MLTSLIPGLNQNIWAIQKAPNGKYGHLSTLKCFSTLKTSNILINYFIRADDIQYNIPKIIKHVKEEKMIDETGISKNERMDIISKEVSLKSILNQQIGILHVDLNNQQAPIQIPIFKEDEPLATVKAFLKKYNLADTKEIAQNLCHGIQKIQEEWVQKQKQSKSPPSRPSHSPTPQTIIVSDFSIYNPANEEDIYISALIHMGNNRKSKLIIKKNENIKKVIEKFAIKFKLPTQMKDKLQNQIEYKYTQNLNSRIPLK